MKTAKILLALVFIFALDSCVFTSTYTNREQDRKDAEKVTDRFFDFIKAKNYDGAYDLFGDDFYSVTPKSKLRELFLAIQDKLGDLQRTNLDKWETKIVIGTDPSSQYVLRYQNQHEKFSSVEEFKLLKEPDGAIRILYYHIASAGFLKK